MSISNRNSGKVGSLICIFIASSLAASLMLIAVPRKSVALTESVTHTTMSDFETWTSLENLTAGDDEVKLENLGNPGENWAQATSAANWSARRSHSLVAYNNIMWVIGGYNGTFLNDVWHSADGENWTQATSSAAWSGRYGHTSIVYDGKMWVIGGYNGTFLNDVWHSADGVNWTQATASASWTARLGHTSLTYNDKMWVIGGGRDVWYSDNGRDWFQATNIAYFGNRRYHTSTVYDGKMWVMGGNIDATLTSDVCYSENGKDWFSATLGADWPSRSHHTSVDYENKMWIIGGGEPSHRNDVWYSPPYNSSGTITSSELDSTDLNITSVTATWNASTPSGTSITVYVSNNGGATWESVENNIQHSFVSVGSSLKYKVTFGTDILSKTPVLYDIRLDYQTITPSMAPTAPTGLLCEEQTNPTGVTDTTPEFSAVYNDPNTGDIANKYRIQVSTDSSFASVTHWDSGSTGTSMSNVTQGNRCANITYGGSALSSGTRYYWRIKFWDVGGLEGDWSSAANFTMYETNLAPSAPELISPENDATINDSTPTFTWWASTDPEGDKITYSFQADNNSSFSSLIISESGLTDNTYIVPDEEALADGLYYWRVQAVDNHGNSSDWSNAWSFTIDVTVPSINNLTVAPDPFSPDGDGENDNTTITANFSENVSWVLSIHDNQETNVRTYSNSALTMNLNCTWNGTYDNGQVVPNGTYKVRVEATDNAGNGNSAENNVTVSYVARVPEITIEVIPDYAAGVIRVTVTSDDNLLDLLVTVRLPDNTIDNVEMLYVGEIWVGERMFKWEGSYPIAQAGTYTVTADSMDMFGSTSSTAAPSIEVTLEGMNFVLAAMLVVVSVGAVGAGVYLWRRWGRRRKPRKVSATKEYLAELKKRLKEWEEEEKKEE